MRGSWRDSMPAAGVRSASRRVYPGGGEPRRSPGPALQQQITDADVTDLLPVEHDRHFVAGPVVPLLVIHRLVARPAGVGVHLDAAIDEVDDPVPGHTVAGVEPALGAAVEGQ